jgi:hypothetical protein
MEPRLSKAGDSMNREELKGFILLSDLRALRGKDD